MLDKDSSDPSIANYDPDIVDRFGFAQSVAREAGQLALGYFESRQDLEVESKGVHDRVTLADRAVEEHIRKTITDQFPRDGFLGEESTAAGANIPGDSSIWVVDPIDGTDCFVFGMPTWCVSIAYVSGGKTQVGAVFDPVHGEMFASARGRGSFLNGRELCLDNFGTIQSGLVGIGHSMRVPPIQSLDALERLMKSGGMFHRCGSGALSLAWVATGRLAGYFEAHMNSWDCLAGLLLVEEAGGSTNDFLEGDGLYAGNPVVASAPGIIAQMEFVAGLDGGKMLNRPSAPTSTNDTSMPVSAGVRENRKT